MCKILNALRALFKNTAVRIVLADLQLVDCKHQSIKLILLNERFNLLFSWNVIIRETAVTAKAIIIHWIAGTQSRKYQLARS